MKLYLPALGEKIVNSIERLPRWEEAGLHHRKEIYETKIYKKYKINLINYSPMPSKLHLATTMGVARRRRN